ncbi:hypothetical protein LTR53_010896 [Teratosphaeriaceae sp. CCFEE 6253]|nr:hypothetical protein LTR53_010896 [Teratosphaeriaceae sp. CCFEE 6253]
MKRKRMSDSDGDHNQRGMQHGTPATAAQSGEVGDTNALFASIIEDAMRSSHPVSTTNHGVDGALRQLEPGDHNGDRGSTQWDSTAQAHGIEGLGDSMAESQTSTTGGSMGAGLPHPYHAYESTDLPHGDYSHGHDAASSAPSGYGPPAGSGSNEDGTETLPFVFDDDFA